VNAWLRPRRFRRTPTRARQAHRSQAGGVALRRRASQRAVSGRHHVRLDRVPIALDLSSRRVVGWVCAEHIRAALVFEALARALGGMLCAKHRRPRSRRPRARKAEGEASA